MNKNLIKIISLIIISLPVYVYAQIPFVHYEAVPNYQINSQGLIVPIGNNPFTQNDKQSNSAKTAYPVVGAYMINSNGKLKRIKIQVNEESNQFGISSVYLRGTYDSIYSIWRSCNTPATKVDQYMDGEFISNNFEWKVESISFGTIYFNY